MNLTYTKYEFLRLWRNKRFAFFSVVFPLVLFIVFGGSNRNSVIPDTGGLNYLLFYMVAMAGYGAMTAAIAGGARIAAERSIGWTRLLRLTPLRPSRYFASKVLTAYVMSLISIVLLFAAGLIMGVRTSNPGHWAEMVGLILIGIAPFVALGIAIGHVLTVDSMGPALGGGAAMFAFLGGMWFPLPKGSVLEKIGEYVPAYWIAQASRVGIGGDSWSTRGWLVVAVWTVVMALLAMRAFQRDTRRV